ncbi:helix-turn-helix transcriptional regulator [Nocardioides coralli]|uniref:helix-turn-helix transcriptional regulator n=1 Tax=Nocardioides coralli TaxID=2872154 RepID=UPI001CA38AF1|nr:LuxR family transcriptional regulator [Nocardioides coralli]QZY28802.1 LuxR C-terminal-related transcriptional regulator [Nocardioides coralli]
MLVGRDLERRALAELLAGARVGEGRALVVSGEPGVGKTALLEDAAGLATGMRVLRAQGVDAERMLAFAGLSQLLAPLLPLLDEVPGVQSEALRSALLLGDADPGPVPTRFAVGAAALSLLSRAAEDRPLAVLVDDGHLLDEASADALVFASRRLTSDAVAVLVALRPGEPEQAWSPLPRLDLAGIDLPAAATLLGEETPEDRVRRLHHATGGNPLALLELRDADLGPGPADLPLPVSVTVGRAFLDQTRDLDDDARTTLLVAATDGSSLVRVLDAARSLGVAAPTLTLAVDAGLVSVREDRVEFRHPLVRSAVYGAAPPAVRRDVHRALAAVVPPTQPERLAWHLSQSAVAPDDDTATTLQSVARTATSRGAHAVAATALERAAELAGTAAHRAGLLVESAYGAWLAGWPQRALDLADRAVATAPDARVRAQQLRGAVLTRAGSLPEAQATLLAAAAEAADADPALAVSLYSDAVHATFLLADAAAATRCCTALDRLLETVTDADVVALARMASGMALVVSGRGAEGVDRVREALAPVAAGTASDQDLLRHPLLLQGALWVRERGPVRDAVIRAMGDLRDRAALGSLPLLLMQLGREAATTDRWDDAASAYSEGIRLARETGQTNDLAMALAGLAVLEARRGRAEPCEAYAAEAAGIAERDTVRVAGLWAAAARGDLAAGRGDPAAAVGPYERVESLLAGTGFADPDQSCTPELVEVLLHLGRPAEAAERAAAHAGLAEQKGEAWALARAARTRGLCADTPEQAEAAFAEALELHAGTPDRYEAARTRLALGARLRRERRRVDARPPLREALSAFEDLGARPWADRTAQELEATGETAQRRDLGPVEQLTPQERQIAQLLAEGRTTREAAGALFLSPKTVEYHLRHVYQKLGIRSRTELAAAMADRSSTPTG